MLYRPISKSFPLLAPVAIRLKRALKQIQTRRHEFALLYESTDLFPYKIVSHKSVLRRSLGTSDPKLQERKVINLRLAAPLFQGIVLPPQHSFSFWKILGNPTRERGFVDGMLISNGIVTTGIGGGLCQLANLLYWMFLHTPLCTSEHHHHEVDIFPDSGRVLPFGSGASIFYNYVDLQVENPTSQSFQLRVRVSDDFWHGEIWSNKPIENSFSVAEEGHHFYKSEGNVFRANELYQIIRDKRTGNRVEKKLITKNNSRVLYPVENVLLASHVEECFIT